MGKPFFPGLVKYMASGPVVAMVWEGPTLLTLLQEPSGEISVSRLDVTSATGPTLWSPPTRRSPSGSSRRSSAAGSQPRRTGSTSNSSLVPGGFYLQATHCHDVLFTIMYYKFYVGQL